MQMNTTEAELNMIKSSRTREDKDDGQESNIISRRHNAKNMNIDKER